MTSLQAMIEKLEHAPQATQWSSGALLVFALIFLGVGVTRTVEFEGLGLSALRRRMLGLLHILGCVIFAAMLALLAIDIEKSQDSILVGMLLSSLILLFPIHIYVGLLRRVRATK